MEHYSVVARSDEDHVATLLDAQGALHLARFAGYSPQVGEDLDGEPAALGFHLLLSSLTGAVFRATFESIDCARQAATLQAAQPYLRRIGCHS